MVRLILLRFAEVRRVLSMNLQTLQNIRFSFLKITSVLIINLFQTVISNRLHDGRSLNLKSQTTTTAEAEDVIR
jgi:hypothetical protein